MSSPSCFILWAGDTGVCAGTNWGTNWIQPLYPTCFPTWAGRGRSPASNAVWCLLPSPPFSNLHHFPFQLMKLPLFPHPFPGECIVNLKPEDCKWLKLCNQSLCIAAAAASGTFNREMHLKWFLTSSANGELPNPILVLLFPAWNLVQHWFLNISLKTLKTNKYCAPNKLHCLEISNLITSVVILAFLIGQENTGNLIETWLYGSCWNGVWEESGV